MSKTKILSKGNPSATFIKIKLRKKEILAYLDTGATLCFGKRNISRNWERLGKPKEIIVADKSKHQIWFVLKNISITIEGHEFFIPTIYLHDSGLDLIIGNNFLKLYAPFVQNVKTISLLWKNLANPKEKTKVITTKIITRNEIIQLISENLINLKSIWEEGKLFLNLEEIEQKLDAVCSEDPLDNLKNTNHELVTIKLRDPNKEINVKYKMPYSVQDKLEFQKDIKELQEKKLITPSASPHSAPAFYVTNHNEIKRGKARMVINYKKLNDATIGDSYKLPRKDYILQKIKGCDWFSSFDAKSGYYQIRLSEGTKPLTAFSCPQGHYQWNVLPFGLKQAPSIYQRFMDNALRGLEHICLAYIDDILVFTKGTKEQHLKDVEIVLNRISEKGIVISKKKSQLAKKEIEYLGLIFKENGTLDLSPHVQEKIQAFPDELKDRKQIQRFLGCLNYIANEGFFKNLATERKILQKKISEKVPWSWTEQDTLTVKTIKRKIKVLPSLYNPTENDFLIVEIDADKTTWAGCMRALPNGKAILNLDDSGNYVGDVTHQQGMKDTGATQYAKSSSSKEKLDKLSDSSEKLVSKDTKIDYSYENIKNKIKDEDLLLCKYVSGSFTDTETRYPIHELETLSCVKVLTKWQMELIPTRFLLRTDSKYVTGFWKYDLRVNYKYGRLVRWQMKLQPFHPYIEYIKSEKNCFADALTREWKQL